MKAHLEITYMHNHGHMGLTVSLSGLTISQQSPWIAASPDGMVLDPSYAHSEGLVELKNPSSVTVVEACEMKKDFALKSNKELFNWTEIMTTTIRSSVSCTAQKELGATLLSEQKKTERIQFDVAESTTKDKKFFFNALLRLHYRNRMVKLQSV